MSTTLTRETVDAVQLFQKPNSNLKSAPSALITIDQKDKTAIKIIDLRIT